MYRERMRPCAACRSPMKKAAVLGSAGRATVDVCEACGAAFFEYFDGEPGALARALDRAGELRPPEPGLPDQTPACPDCHRDFGLLAYLERGPLLYRCSGCMAVFATAEQLGRLAEYLEVLDPPEQSWLRSVLDKLFPVERWT